MPTKFFRVDGADQQTGQETYLVLRAKTRPQAEKLARDQGLLISSIRIASPEDWAATAQEPAADADAVHSPADDGSQAHAQVDGEPIAHPEESNSEAHHDPVPEHFIEPAAEAPDAYAAAASHALARRSGGAAPSAAGAVVLVCAGVALVIGGVLALVLALWPDNTTLRNELQQLDFRLHSLVQTILGGMLVLSGLIVCLIAAVCYLLPRRANS